MDKYKNMIGNRAIKLDGDYYAPQDVWNLDKSAKTQTQYDGELILYCGKCHKPKEVIIDYGNIKHTYCRCVCDCSKNGAKSQKAMDIALERKSVFKGNKGMMDAIIQSDDRRDERASASIRRYIENIESNIKDGKGLFITGDVGTGKTWFASCIINEAISKGKNCFIGTPTEIVNDYIEAKSKNDYMFKLKGYDLFVIDDLGTEHFAGAKAEIFYNIVNTLYCNGTSIIATTNMVNESDDEIEKRIFSRICQRGQGVMVIGTDRRRN